MILDQLLGKKFAGQSLSSPELAALWQPPPSGLNVQRVPSRWIVPRDQRRVEIDRTKPDAAEFVELGKILNMQDEWVSAGCSYRDFRFLCHVTAPMGRGKSEWLKKLFAQLMDIGCAVIMIDCKGTDLVNTSIPLIPLAREKDVRLMEISGSMITGEPMFPAMNMFSPAFARSMGLNNSKLASTLMQVFNVIDSRFRDATIMPLFASMGILALLESESKATLAHLMRFFYDDDYREDCLRRVKNPTVHQFWSIRFPMMEKQQLTPLRGFENRVDRLLAFEEISSLMLAPGCSIDIRQIIDNNGILLSGIKVSDGEISDLAAMLLLTQLQIAALSRNNVPESQRPDAVMVADEAQIPYNKVPELGAVQFAQFRALRVGSIIVHQNMEQLTSVELRSALEGNAQIRVILGTEARDASMYAGLYGEGLSAEDYTGMEKFYHEFLKIHGPIFSARMPGLVKPLDEALPPAVYTDWRTMRAPARNALDRRLDDMIGTFQMMIRADGDSREKAIQRLAGLDDGLFDEYCRRTRLHRLAQAQFILENPGCIPVDQTLTPYEAMIAQKDLRIRTLNALRFMVPMVETAALKRKIMQETQASLARQAARKEQEEVAAKAAKSGAKGSKKAPRLTEDGRDPLLRADDMPSEIVTHIQSVPQTGGVLADDPILQALDNVPIENPVSPDDEQEFAALIATMFDADDPFVQQYTVSRKANTVS